MIQKLAWAYAIVFVVIGLLGFIPMFVSEDLLLGVFSVTAMNNVLYLLSGLLAIAAAWVGGSYPRLYFKVFGILYAFAAIIGFAQGDTVVGLMAVNAANNTLHLIAAIVALWAGFGVKVEVPARAGVAA
ncbi:MAG: DUF4383 domain-containing protein [Candidatus Pacebacteria bacterium]|nr:DUF4383 domain-containing protein [Candidatus Paceibacterota bacterium]